MYVAIQITRNGPEGKKGSPIEWEIECKDVERKIRSRIKGLNREKDGIAG